MKQRGLAIFFILLLAFSILPMIVSAEEVPVTTPSDDLYGSSGGSGFFGSIKNFFTSSGLWNYIEIWLKGGELSAMGNFIKFMVLFLIVLLVYSALSFAGFPTKKDGTGSPVLQFIIALIVGIIATFPLTNQELVTMLTSYKALGIALTVFFPILILGFFTLVVASKANPMGIFLQKIIWVIYSVYLFIKTGALFLAMQYVKVQNGTVVLLKPGEGMPEWLKPFLPGTKEEIAKVLSENDTTMLFILLITSIAVFVIMVLGNKYVEAWLEKEKRDADVAAAQDTAERAVRKQKLDAKALSDLGGKG